MEVVSTEVGGVKVKGAGGDTGSEGSGSATSGGTSSSAEAATANVVSKRRKVDVKSLNCGEWGDASADSARVVQFGRFEVNPHVAAENFRDPVLAVEDDGERCLSSDVEDPGTASCCSSNETSNVEKEKSKSVDQDVRISACAPAFAPVRLITASSGSVEFLVKSGEVDAARIQTSNRRERIPCSEPVGTESADDYKENNAPKLPAVAWNSRRRQLPAGMPSQAEIDDFFFTVEKKAAVQFKEKYNFDFEKEVPLRGRYKWKPLAAAAPAAAASKEKEIIEA